MSYNVRIPEPKVHPNKIAYLFCGSITVHVFWLKDTHQVLFHILCPNEKESCWCIQPDGDILDSLCYFFPYHYYQYVFQIFDVESQIPVKVEDFYTSHWSKFANTENVLYMVVTGLKFLQSEEDRQAYLSRPNH
jgi:hypothetical protein